MESILVYVKNNKNNFSIMSVNIECILTKFEECLTIITFLKESRNFSFSVICLHECWLQKDSEDDTVPNTRLQTTCPKTTVLKERRPNLLCT